MDVRSGFQAALKTEPNPHSAYINVAIPGKDPNSPHLYTGLINCSNLCHKSKGRPQQALVKTAVGKLRLRRPWELTSVRQQV